MADQILDQVRDVVEGQIDFEGQKLAELIVNVALSLIGVSVIDMGDTLALYIVLGGSVLVFALVVPPWPFFNRHPVKWLPVGGGAQIQAPANLVIDQKAIR
ncbi:microsomal signal peptidase 12kDa subunit [Coniochaeta sp. 2T2.1]|nr:microsomal signal peptidase 12kDa subunit [Coniochaeta sp. 2T2.1]